MISSTLSRILVVAVVAIGCSTKIFAKNYNGCDLIIEELPGGKVSLASNVTSNTTCVWRWNTTKVEHLYISFQTLKLQQGDVLEVYDGSNKTRKSFQNFTESKESFMLVTSSNETTFILRTGNMIDLRIVDITYQNNVCTQTFTGSSATFSAPIYPISQGMLKCAYYLKLKDTSQKQQLVLSLTKLKLKKGMVKIMNGTHQIAKYTDGNVSLASEIFAPNGGKVLGLKITISTLKEQVIDGSFVGVNPDCSGEVYAPVILKSLAYPHQYENNLDCRWLVHVNTSSGATKLQASVLGELDLPDVNDRISLKDGMLVSSPDIATISKGFEKDTVMLSSGTCLWIRFSTNEVITGKGFQLDIKPQVYGGLYTAASDNITINSSASVNKNIKQVHYIIQAPSLNQQVLLDINSAVNCSIYVYCGNKESDPLMGKFSYIGNKSLLYRPLVSTKGNTMLVVVNKTPATAKNFSFSAKYTSAHQGTFYNSYDAFGGINIVQKNATNFTWFIQPQSDGHIALLFSTLMLTKDGSLTLSDFLGQNKIIVSLATSSIIVRNKIHMLAKNGVKVNFVTKTADALKITATFQLVQVCSSAKTGILNGNITSPGYPSPYPINANCVWNVSKNISNNLVHFSFVEFDLRNPTDNVSITSMKETVLIKPRKEGVPTDLVVNASAGVNLQFISSFDLKMASKPATRGFSLNYDTIDCGGNVIDKGTISTPMFPRMVTKPLVCIWVVKVTADTSTKSLPTIVKFNYQIKFSKYSKHSGVEIYDGNSMQHSNLINIKLLEAKTITNLSMTDTIVVRYHAIGNTAGMAFKMDIEKYLCNKKQLCRNGRCMHPDWICDGIDQCGDMTDETDCGGKIVPPAKCTAGVTVTTFVLSLIGVSLLTVLLMCVTPVICRRLKLRQYRSFNDLLVPVNT